MPVTIPHTRAGFDRARLIERPDGFYWQSAEDGREYGPFATLSEAAEDMELAGAETEAEAADHEALSEAEAEIGIADWIDPDTGELAEVSIPHIEDR